MNGDPCKVLPLGDSITFGLNYAGSYRVELFRQALTAGQKITFVGTLSNGPDVLPGTSTPFPKSHEGRAGAGIAAIASAAQDDVVLGPHIVLLHAGSVDVSGSDAAGAPSRLSTAVENLSNSFPSALIVVAQIIPMPSSTAAVAMFNQAIPGMVQDKASAGKHVVMADLNTGFVTSLMLADGFHPNQNGYQWMANAWYSVIGRVLPKQANASF